MLTTVIDIETNELASVNMADMFFVGYESRAIIIVGQAKTYRHPITLTELRPLGFHAFSRSALVNLSNYEKFDAATASFTFKTGSRCRVADKYVDVLEQLLHNYVPAPINYSMAVYDPYDDNVVSIDLATVDYVDLAGRVPIYHVGGRKYTHITFVEQLESDAMYSLGFRSMDRGSFVNLPKVRALDRKHGRLYFNEEMTGPSASITRINYEAINEFVYQVIDKRAGERNVRPLNHAVNPI